MSVVHFLHPSGTPFTLVGNVNLVWIMIHISLWSSDGTSFDHSSSRNVVKEERSHRIEGILQKREGKTIPRFDLG